jgi:HEPN domain-containing protein
MNAGFHEWACFISQQAAEKALKAVLQSWGAEAWGHAVLQLLAAVEERTEVAETLRNAARLLDRYYIPARCPNGYSSGKPGDYIVEEDASRATSGAEEIVRFCHGLLA